MQARVDSLKIFNPDLFWLGYELHFKGRNINILKALHIKIIRVECAVWLSSTLGYKSTGLTWHSQCVLLLRRASVLHCKKKKTCTVQRFYVTNSSPLHDSTWSLTSAFTVSHFSMPSLFLLICLSLLQSTHSSSAPLSCSLRGTILWMEESPSDSLGACCWPTVVSSLVNSNRCWRV